MGINTERYIRKPLYVDAVRITEENFDEIAEWCQGEVQQEETPGGTKRYIKVRVHNPKNTRQTQAIVGDWLLYTERGYKIYTSKAFHASFDRAVVTDPKVVEEAPTPLGEIAKEEITRAETPVEVPESALEDVPPPLDQQVKAEMVDNTETKRVISIREQHELSGDEVRELLIDGAVLEQDVSEGVTQA